MAEGRILVTSQPDQASGLIAWLESHPGAIAQRTLRDLAKAAQAEAWAEFMANKGPDGGMGLRFSPRAWDVLGLTHRGARYEKHKTKKFSGRNLPYVSPGNKGTVHTRDIIGVRQVGWNTTARFDANTVQTTLTLPGARGTLNRIRAPFGAIYRRELLQIATRARHQGLFVLKRANEIFFAKLIALMQAEPPKAIPAPTGAA